MKPTSNSIQRAGQGDRGQGMTEYILIVFLVAVAVLGMVGIFGNQVRTLFGMSADALAGRTGKSESASAVKNGGTDGVH